MYAITRFGDRSHQHLWHFPVFEQCGGQLQMIKAEGIDFQSPQVDSLLDHARQELRIRLLQLAQQHQHANVLKQPGKKRVVARTVEQLLADLTGGNGGASAWSTNTNQAARVRLRQTGFRAD